MLVLFLVVPVLEGSIFHQESFALHSIVFGLASAENGGQFVVVLVVGEELAVISL